jgi:hypothetical protein
MSINKTTLVEQFGLNETLKINDSKILESIRNKIDINQNDIERYLNYKNMPSTGNTNTSTKEKKINNTDFMKVELTKNSIVIASSALLYIYFTRISDYMIKANSLKIFKPVFLFTFCLAPIGISLYNTKLDYEIKN